MEERVSTVTAHKLPLGSLVFDKAVSICMSVSGKTFISEPFIAFANIKLEVLA